MKDQTDDANDAGFGDVPEMHARTIAMNDGRYMVFYTFDGEGPPPEATEIPGAPQETPDV